MTVFDRIKLILGDITQQNVDVIVNAANGSLLGGSGVDGAIHREAGPELLAETKSLGGCAIGEAKVSRGYRLKAKHVIHTVGPIYKDGRRGEADLLASCHRRSLELAEEIGADTVAFPAISTGIYGYPLKEAARIALKETARFLADHERPREVRFVLFGDRALRAFQEALESLRK